MPLNRTDLRIDSFQNAAPGQPVFVRVTHIPTGNVVEAMHESRIIAEAQALAWLEELLSRVPL